MPARLILSEIIRRTLVDLEKRRDDRSELVQLVADYAIARITPR